MNGAYRVILTPAAKRDLDRFYGTTLEQLRQAIEQVGQQPRSTGCKKLRGSAAMYRKRSGNYRILFEIDDSAHQVTIHGIVDRKHAY